MMAYNNLGRHSESHGKLCFQLRLRCSRLRSGRTHCLHRADRLPDRGHEIHSPASVVFEHADNRMRTIKAVMPTTLAG